MRSRHLLNADFSQVWAQEKKTLILRCTICVRLSTSSYRRACELGYKACRACLKMLRQEGVSGIGVHAPLVGHICFHPLHRVGEVDDRAVQMCRNIRPPDRQTSQSTSNWTLTRMSIHIAQAESLETAQGACAADRAIAERLLQN